MPPPIVKSASPTGDEEKQQQSEKESVGDNASTANAEAAGPAKREELLLDESAIRRLSVQFRQPPGGDTTEGNNDSDNGGSDGEELEVDPDTARVAWSPRRVSDSAPGGRTGGVGGLRPGELVWPSRSWQQSFSSVDKPEAFFGWVCSATSTSFTRTVD